MKKLLLVFGFVIFGIALNAQTSSYYYYYEGKKQFLSLNTEFAFLSLPEPILPSDILQRNISYTEFKSDNSDKKTFRENQGISRFHTRLSLNVNLTEEQYWALLNDIKQNNPSAIISPFFKTRFNTNIGLSNFFYVKLKEAGDTTLLMQMAEQNNTLIVEQDTFMPLWFILSTTENTLFNALEYCNIFYESNLFQSVEPDLMYENLLLSVPDPYYPNQWGLKNIGQYQGISGMDIKAEQAWELSTGSNVIIAFIDQGIDTTHPDLAANMHPLSFNCQTGTSPQIVTCEGNVNHGTPCAGIAGALQNDIGITGVAPDCNIMSIST